MDEELIFGRPFFRVFEAQKTEFSSEKIAFLLFPVAKNPYRRKKKHNNKINKQKNFKSVI